MHPRLNAKTHRFALTLRLLLLGGVALLAACYPANSFVDPENGSDAPGDPEVISFGTDIQPIFDAHCITCHQPGGEAFAHGITLDLTRTAAYDSLSGKASQQDPNFLLIQPSAPDLSYLYIKVSPGSPPRGLRMPPFQQLSDADLQKISSWIISGALKD
jgi:mono/diheme cytochrome c family protein